MIGTIPRPFLEKAALHHFERVLEYECGISGPDLETGGPPPPQGGAKAAVPRLARTRNIVAIVWIQGP